MRDAANPLALKWALARTDTEEQDVVVLTARMVGAGGPELLDASEQSFSEHEQMLFTKAVSVAESFGKHINLLVVPAGDIFAAIVQTANSLEATSVVSGISSKLTPQEQAYYVGQAWEALPEPKRQFTFDVVMEDGSAQAYHIGPHAPHLQPDDVQLVHRLWLNFRRDPELTALHHSDIVTYALTRLATEYARDKQETLKGLKRSTTKDTAPTRAFGKPQAAREGANDYNVLAPKPNADKTDISF
jgi:hypothetical protein